MSLTCYYNSLAHCIIIASSFASVMHFLKLSILHSAYIIYCQVFDCRNKDLAQSNCPLTAVMRWRHASVMQLLGMVFACTGAVASGLERPHSSISPWSKHVERKSLTMVKLYITPVLGSLGRSYILVELSAFFAPVG